MLTLFEMPAVPREASKTDLITPRMIDRRSQEGLDQILGDLPTVAGYP